MSRGPYSTRLETLLEHFLEHLSGQPGCCQHGCIEVIADLWRERIEREVDVLTRAPFFVQEPNALVELRDEIRRLRRGQGSHDDGSSPIIDNARVIQATLDAAARELTTSEIEELELLVDERLVESSLRYR